VGESILSPGWFGEMEVPQMEKIGERYYLFCSVSTQFHSALYRSQPDYRPQTGVKYFVADNFHGPYESLGFLTGPAQDGLYSGKVIQGPDKSWYLMAFMGTDVDGNFIGNIIDPIRIQHGIDGRLDIL
jgi:beta-fructofuranosidase